MDAERKRLITNLWPDKLLYGSVTLAIVGITGIVWALLVDAGEIRYGGLAPDLLVRYPAEVTLLGSGGAVALAAFALARRSTPWGFLGALLGVVAMGFLGLGAALSLVAAAFFLMSLREGEERNPATVRLTADLWPDKSLAAALLSGVNGFLTLAWGAVLAMNLVTLDRLGASQALVGAGAGLLGLLALAAAAMLYRQRGAWLAVVTAVAIFAVFPFVVVGPLLTAGTLVLVGLAMREREFEDPARSRARAAP